MSKQPIYGELEEKIYMECPSGMKDVSKDDCIVLQKWICGLVQAARQYNKKIVEILRRYSSSKAISTHASLQEG